MFDDNIHDGKWFDMLCQMRGRVYAGPLPITMKVFGTLVSLLTVVGGIMLAETGLSTSIKYECTSVQVAQTVNMTSTLSSMEWLVPRGQECA